MRLAVAGPVIILIAVATQTWLSAVLLLVSVMVLPVFHLADRQRNRRPCQGATGRAGRASPAHSSPAPPNPD
jgi:hypothetical protein